MTGDRVAAYALLLGAALLLAAAGTEAAAAVGFLFRTPIGLATLPMGCLASACITGVLSRDERGAWRWRTTAWVLALAALVVVGATSIAGILHDEDWDGLWYHQPAIVALTSGWNPWAGPLGGNAARAALLVNFVADPNYRSAQLFIDHFSKGPWYLAAALVKAGAQLEQAKAFNFVLAVAAALVCFAAIRRIFRVSAARAAIVAAVAVANPVIVCQLFGFYVDGQLGSALTAFVAAGALALYAPERAAWAAFVAATIVAVNVKFTGLVYVTALTVGLCVPLALSRHRRRVLAVLACGVFAIAVATLFVGWNPYVTNARSHGNPFYPVAGVGSIDVVIRQMPQEDFAQRGRFGQLFTSLFSASANGLPGTVAIESKIPLTFSHRELVVFGAPDVRLGGFGPLFGGALLAAGLITAALIACGFRAAAACLFVASGLLASVLLMPAAWWARYVPQLWLVPIALALAPAPRRYRFVSWFQVLLLAVLALNAAMVLASNTKSRVRDEIALRDELRSLANTPSGIEVRVGRMEGVRYLLAVAKIRFRIETALHCANPQAIAKTDASWCPLPGAPSGRDVQRNDQRLGVYSKRLGAARIP